MGMAPPVPPVAILTSTAVSKASEPAEYGPLAQGGQVFVYFGGNSVTWPQHGIMTAKALTAAFNPHLPAMPRMVRFDSFRSLPKTNTDVLASERHVDHVFSCWTAEVTLPSDGNPATMTAPRLRNKSSLNGQNHEYRDYSFTEVDLRSLVPFLTYIANAVRHAFRHDVLEIGWVQNHAGLFDEPPESITYNPMRQAGWTVQMRPSSGAFPRWATAGANKLPFWVHRTRTSLPTLSNLVLILVCSFRTRFWQAWRQRLLLFRWRPCELAATRNHCGSSPTGDL
jgi:hypothetical protein